MLTGCYSYTKRQLEEIKTLGYEITFFQQEKEIESSQVGEIDAVVCNSVFQYCDLSAFHSLKFVQLTSAGYDRIPVERFRERNITVCNAKGVYSIPIAEWAVCRILDLYKQTGQVYENQLNHIWDRNINSYELFGKTCVIAGAGDIGSEIAIRLQAFGVRNIGVVRTVRPLPRFDEVISTGRLAEAVTDADIVINCLPLNDETYELFDEGLFAKFKKGSIFINVSRGKVVDEAALSKALNEQQLAGAALDVFWEEPLKADNKMFNIKNIIISPHVSFRSENVSGRMFEVIIYNLKQYMTGKSYKNVV